MQAVRYIETVGKDGLLQLHLAKPMGSKVEVIILDLDEGIDANQLGASRLQESTGFAKEVLARPAEDVWNDV